jgi:hypothetical protein
MRNWLKNTAILAGLFFGVATILILVRSLAPGAPPLSLRIQNVALAGVFLTACAAMLPFLCWFTVQLFSGNLWNRHKIKRRKQGSSLRLWRKADVIIGP